MFAARVSRATPRLAQQLRAPAQRRFASTNEFINERQHIKEHAQGTTGMSYRANWSSGSIC
jgi:cytochrome c oxidase subunit 6a